jgi:hypothetical protein
MRKFFTFFAAMLVSLTMFAQTTIANFEVTLTADPTTTYASYSDDDADYTCYKIGSASTSNFFKASDGKYYLKLTGDDAHVQITLKSGSFAADDVVYYALNHSSKKTGIGFKFAKSSATTTVDMTAAGTEIVGQYTLTAADIEDDGSIKMLRASSNTFVNRIYVVRPQAETNPVTKVTVSGPEKGVKGYASVFSATTDVKPTAYQWFVNDVAQNEAVGKTFEYTPAEGGNYNIVCKARNDNNAEGEWVASDALVFAVSNSLCGEIIKATLKGGPDADVSGIVGGTFDSNLKSGKYKIDKGYYAGIILAEGNFQAGDTVIITMSAAGGNYPCLFGDKDRNNLLFLATEGSEALEYRIVLTESANNVNALYVSRDANEADGYKWNPTLTSIAVVRPMPIKSKTESLTAVKVNGNAISASNLADLVSDHYVMLDDKQYVSAPVVTYTKQVTIIYDDDSQQVTDEDIEVTAEYVEVNMVWEAEANINGIDYRVIMQKAPSHTVTYMYGAEVLGTEEVGHGEHPAEYKKYETMPLATFGGWYIDAELGEEIAYMEDEVINSDITYYAKFTKTYLHANVNIEQLVLDYGTKYDIASALTAAGWVYENIDALDTLNDIEKKDNRNEAFLGLKLKKSTSYIACWLKAGDLLLTKFGNVGCNIKYIVKGATIDAEYPFTAAEIAESEHVLPIGYLEEDVYVKIVLTDAKTVVLKQLMLDEIAEVTLPAPGAYLVTCEENENGKVEVSWPNKKYRTPVGETVTITATPNEGYALASITVNGTAIEAVEGVYSFVMPAEEVTVAATFTSTTALENLKAEGKAVKVVIDGQLYIKKGDKLFNALGTMMK